MRELISEKAPGPSPSFSQVQVVKALELIAERPIGRNRLSRRLSLGEGATRTLIERLKRFGLIRVDHKGCVFSEGGVKLWTALHNMLPRKIILGRSDLTLGEFNVAILVKGVSQKVKSGIEQRDAALMVGAQGATTLTFVGGELVFPPEHAGATEDFPKIPKELIQSLKPEENDTIVIGSAETLVKAEYGALAAALILLNSHINR